MPMFRRSTRTAPRSSSRKPAASKPAASKPAASKPAAKKPAAKKPAAKKPAAKKPATSKPAASKPAASKPAASKPAAKEPAKKASTAPSKTQAPRHAPPPAEIKTPAPTPEPIIPNVPITVASPPPAAKEPIPDPLPPIPIEAEATIKMPDVASVVSTSTTIKSPVVPPPPAKPAASMPLAQTTIATPTMAVIVPTMTVATPTTTAVASPMTSKIYSDITTPATIAMTSNTPIVAAAITPIISPIITSVKATPAASPSSFDNMRSVGVQPGLAEISNININSIASGDKEKAAALSNSSFQMKDIPTLKNPNVKVLSTSLFDKEEEPAIDLQILDKLKARDVEVIVKEPPAPPPTTALPVPVFQNINIKNTEIEVFYSIKDEYDIEEGENGTSVRFGWLSDLYLKKSAYVDVILSMQVGDVIEDLVRRVYLDTSVKSFISLKDEALSKRRRPNLDVMYKATFEPFLYWDNMPTSAQNMIQLLDKTELTNMSVTIRTGLDAEAFQSMRDAPFEGSVIGSENTKDIIISSKIKNYTRTSADTEPVIDKIITDEIIFDRILRQLKNSRIFTNPSTVKAVNSDDIYDRKRSFNSFFSPLFLSEDLSDEVRGMFFFDRNKFLEQYKLGEAQQGVENTSYICNVKVTRSRVLLSERNSDFSSNIMFRKFDEVATPVVVMNKMFDANSYVGENTRQLSNLDSVAYCFVDKDISKRKAGQYKYDVEISVKDDTAKYFVRKLNILRARLRSFDKYMTFTEMFNNTVDPTTGLFTSKFDKAAKLWWSTTGDEAQEPWRSAPIEVIRTLQDDSPVLDIDMSQYIIPLLRICHPATGNEKGQSIVKLAIERVIKFYEDRLAPYGKNMGSSFQGQTNRKTPSSGAGDYEKVTKFSYTFKEYIDRTERKNLRARYFGDKENKPEDGLCYISSGDYRAVTNSNQIALLGEEKGLPTEISFNGKIALSNVNSRENDTSMTFLTPVDFCMGTEKYVIDDFLEPADQERDEDIANRRAQIYEDTTFADNASSTESFMNKYGLSLTPLSTPETSIRPKLPSGTGQIASKRKRKYDEISDTSADAEVSRRTMNALIGSMVDGENSEILLDNPILEASITKGRPGKVSINNFSGDSKTLTQDDFNALPTHIKAVLIYLSKTSDPFTLNEDSYIKLMADNFESDVNDSYDARFFYELFYKQIQRVQFLSGFQKNKDKNPEYQTPIFKDLTKKNLLTIPDGDILCRIIPYENKELSYDANRGINGEPTEKYFILNYRENSFKNKGSKTNSSKAGKY